MSDCAYTEINVSAADAERFDFDGWSFDQEETENGIVNFVDEQANYGGTELLEVLRDEGIPYFGFHGAGDDYGPALFAFDGLYWVDAPSLADDGRPMIPVNADGTIAEGQLEAAQNYWRVLQAAKGKMAATLREVTK